jgi:hypothetical protein
MASSLAGAVTAEKAATQAHQQWLPTQHIQAQHLQVPPEPLVAALYLSPRPSPLLTTGPSQAAVVVVVAAAATGRLARPVTPITQTHLEAVAAGEDDLLLLQTRQAALAEQLAAVMAASSMAAQAAPEQCRQMVAEAQGRAARAWAGLAAAGAHQGRLVALALAALALVLVLATQFPVTATCLGQQQELV